MNFLGFIKFFIFVYGLIFIFLLNKNVIMKEVYFLIFKNYKGFLGLEKDYVESFNFFYLLILFFLFIMSLGFLFSNESFLMCVPFLILWVYLMVMLNVFKKLSSYNYVMEGGLFSSFVFYFMEVFIIFFRSITLFMRVLVNLVMNHVLSGLIYYFFLNLGFGFWGFMMMFLGLYEFIMVLVQVYVLIILLINYLNE